VRRVTTLPFVIRTVAVSVHADRDGCFHVDCFAVQQIRLVFVIANGIKDGRPEEGRAGDYGGIANSPFSIKLKCHDHRGCKARGHRQLRALKLGLVDEKFLRNIRGDLNLVELVGAGVSGRLRG
jgi:hypothetical protein